MRLLRDTWILFAHNMRMSLKNPGWVIIGLFQPALYVLLFAPLLNAFSGVPGFPTGGGLAVFTPGAMVMISVYGPVLAGYTLIAKLRTGEIERLSVTPASRLSLLLGGVLRDVVLLLAQGVLLIAIAFLVGLRLTSGAGVGLGLVLLALMGVLLTSCSSALALIFKDESALAPIVQILSGPLLLLSGFFLPMTLAPDWLQKVAAFNPLAYVISAMRVLFAGNLASSSVWQGFSIIVPLTILALWWAARSYRKVAV